MSVENAGKAIGMLFFAFLCLMTWVCLGIVAFAVVIQWILLLIVPKDLYPYVFNAVITAWCLFGVWFAFIYYPRKEKKENDQ